MGRVLPVLFNTDMVQVILEGNKTATRRVIKYPPHPDMPDNHNYCKMPLWMRVGKDKYGFRTLHYMDVNQTRYFESLAPFDKEDILYVRETWAFKCCIDCMDNEDDEECMLEKTPVIHEDRDSVSEGCYIYRADHPCPERIAWRPSIHMPKAAARIWLKVTDVRVDRLQDMALGDFLREGVTIRPEAYNDPDNAYGQARDNFIAIWDSTVSRQDKGRYGWEANPWVWVIGFERCGKPELRLEA